MEGERTPQKIKHARVLTLREMAGKSKNQPSCKSAFFIEMRPILIGFAILGRLCFGFDKQGKMESRLFTFRSVYCISVFVLLSCIATADVRALWERFMMEKNFIQSVQLLINFTLLACHFVLPLPLYLESDRICHFFNEWADYQEIYEKLTFDVLTTKYDRHLRISVCVTPFLVAGIVLYESTVFFNEIWYHLIIYFDVLVLVYFYQIFWCCSLMEIGNCAEILNEKLKKSVGKLCDAKEIHRYRVLWLRLNKLLESAGGSIPFSMMKMMISTYSAFIMSAYVVISCLIQGISYEAFQFLGIVTGTWLIISFCMEAGHQATQKVDKVFFDTLMETDIADMDDKCLKEFNLFVKLVSQSSSVVTLAGYVPVNRTAIAALLASTVTYLIVLVQFNQSPAVVH